MDEPKTLRGTDTGMNPVEMLLCCLGACYASWRASSPGKRRSIFRISGSKLEGDKDGVRAGLREIRHTFHIRTDADEEKVRPKGIVINR